MNQQAKHRFSPGTVALVVGLMSGTALAQSDLQSGPRFSGGFTFEEKDGKSLYEGICQGCHMPDAKGATGAGTYPALAGNPRLASSLYPATIVLKGLRSMPAFGGPLNDEQIAEVVNYVRTHFGNDYKDTLSAATVNSLHPDDPGK